MIVRHPGRRAAARAGVAARAGADLGAGDRWWIVHDRVLSDQGARSMSSGIILIGGTTILEQVISIVLAAITGPLVYSVTSKGA